jgi:hypothetical protein
MKICVLGAGSASAIALLAIFDRLKGGNISDIDIYCLHHPLLETFQVGETTSSNVLMLLSKVLKFNVLNDGKDIDATVKWGSKYYWNDVNGDDFFINMAMPGLHLDSTKFSKYVIERLKQEYASNMHEIIDYAVYLNESEKNVTVVCEKGEYDFDFVIDCRGVPPKDELEGVDYSKPQYEFVNSVILYPEQTSTNEQITSIYPHKNGWMFGIPLQSRKTYGYLYNNKITTYKDAVEDFSRLKNIDASTLRNFTWQPYFKNLAIVGRTLSLGNRLYLYDPTQGMPLHYYFYIINFFLTPLLLNKTKNLIEISSKLNGIHALGSDTIQDVTALNYCGPNKINSDFWNISKQLAFNRLNTSPYFKSWARSNINLNKTTKTPTYSTLWEFPTNYISDIINGYKINIKDYYS